MVPMIPSLAILLTRKLP
jgi:hypothetical protein